jgi:hypothetical protein
VDINNYENPFASSKREIGQMDVAIKEEELIRESVRRIILESTEFGCNKHSLGFIDGAGKYIDLAPHSGKAIDVGLGDNHDSYIWANVDPDADSGSCPRGWLKLSNANEIWFNGTDLFDINSSQIQGLISMWASCKSYSQWLKTDVEKFYVQFYTAQSVSQVTGNVLDWELHEFTVPEFLEQYGGRRATDNFFDMLLA